MKKSLLFFYSLLVSARLFSQGCTVSVSAPRDTIVCGDHISLSAYGQGQGIAMLSENFNGGSFGTGWSSTQQVMWNNPCSPGGADGTPHAWMGNSSPVPRVLTTNSFNLSSCASAGVTICFDMMFAEQGGNAPCEGPDEPPEGLYLQYSIDNGSTWTTIHYFDPNGGYDPVFINWTNWCYPVPAVALTANTRFRWFQDADSGADYDHWGLDNVVIYCNDPTYNVVFTHDGYVAGPAGGTDPTAVHPHTTTSYEVVMSNGTYTCRDTVRIVVRNPDVVVNAGNDTAICAGQCATLNATAKTIISPAKVATYSNNELTAIATGLGTVTDIGINITNLNQVNVLPNAIQQVCINNVFFFGFGGFPPTQVDISDLVLTLSCPGGQQITLVPANVTTGANNQSSGGYTNTCFVPGGANIATGTAPYTGNWAPNQPFNNLAGCTANGVWELGVRMNSSFGFGQGTFSGWSITFDDPEISYVGNFSWSPTANMTNSTTLAPTVCPPTTQIYTLTMSDTAGCVTQSDNITVTVQPSCCSLNAGFSVTQPSCGASNGSINVTPSPSGSYSYNWNDGITTQNRTNIAAGSYSLTITNTADPSCTFDTTIVLNSGGSLSVNLVDTDPTCAGGSSDGSVTLTIIGGTAPFVITIDTGGTPVTVNVPVNPGPYTISNIGAGAVSVSVQDAANCTASASATLIAPDCCSIALSAVVTQPTCGQSDGSISVTPQPAGNYAYSWSGGLPPQASQTNLAAGQYTVTITNSDIANCTKDTIITLNSANAPIVTFTDETNPTCAGADGSATINVSGGTAPYQITVDTGGTPQVISLPMPISYPLTGLSAGMANVTVTDAAGCTASASTTLTAPANCCTFVLDAAISQPTCGADDGAIQITSSNGSGNYSYSWAGGETTPSLSSVGVGVYNITVSDNAYANCSIDTSFTLSNPGAPVINNVSITNETCSGTMDGSASINASGGNSPYTYFWNNGQTTATAVALSAGNYSFTVTDNTGCQASGSAVVAANSCCLLATSAIVTNGSCNQANAFITVNIDTDGTVPYSYSINGAGFQSSNVFNDLAAGNYSITTRDVNGCEHTVSATVPPSSNNLTVAINTTPISCAGLNDASATAVSNGGSQPFSYLWSNSATTETISSLSSGTYSVSVSDANGCSGTATVMINSPAPLVLDLGEDIAVCENQAVSINAGGTYTGYQWNNGETSSSVIPQIGGIYSLTVTDANGCTATDSISITFATPPIVDLGEDKTTISGSTVSLTAAITPNPNSMSTYLWEPDSLLRCVSCAVAYAEVKNTITYTLTYTDQYGCTASDDITIYIIPDGRAYFPNAFSPNGDGSNDIYKPYGIHIKNISYAIYNRWGEKLFESNSELIGWDGKYKGALQPAGIYVYSAKVVFLNGEVQNQKGSITIIR